MAESILNFAPGSLALGSVQELLQERVKDRVIASLPPYLVGAVEVAKIAKAAGAAIAASLTGGPLAVVGAAAAAFQAINGALNGYAAAFEANLGNRWSDAIETLSLNLANEAKGRMLATYQPSNTLTLKRALAKSKKCSDMTKAFRPGYVICVERPGRSDYIAATVPVLIFTGEGAFGEWIRQSNYDPQAKAIGPLTTANGWKNENKWRPLGLDKSQASELGFGNWISLIEKLVGANACPPVQSKTTVCPGLAPYWGPYGQSLPAGPSLLAYHAGLMSSPPPDLDFVADIVAGDFLIPDKQATGIIDLLWSREDLAQRGLKGLTPRGAQWGGPFWQLVGGEPPGGFPPDPDLAPDDEDLDPFYTKKGIKGQGQMEPGVVVPGSSGGGAGIAIVGVAALGALMLMGGSK